MDVSGTERLQDEHGRLLEANNLQFAYDNGLITAICPSENETAFTQNVKVSILSHLQVTMNSFQLPSVVIEDDISGRCLTRYFPKPSAERADAWTIRKVKSTAGCANKYSRKTRFDGIDLRLAQLPEHHHHSRQRYHQHSQPPRAQPPTSSSTAYSSSSSPPPPPPASVSNNNTETSISSATSTEAAAVKTWKIFVDKEEPIKRIEFGHTAVFVDVNAQTANLVEANQTLTAVLVGDFTNRATSFANLIRLIRKMDSEQLEELYNIYKDTKQAKDLLKQAIYSAGTEVALTHLMNELNAGQFNAPIFQLSLLPSPNLTQIEIIGNLLRSTDVKSLGLIVSTLVDRYCQSHPRCMQDEIILKNLRQLESSLRYDCSTDSEEARDGVIITLRAIGNVGRVSNKSEVYPVLERCLLQPNIFLRSATAEVFRKFPCDEEADELLLSILKKRDEEAEVRIQAYLSWSRCLSEGKLLSLLSILLIDPSDQVSSSAYPVLEFLVVKSFVASHLVSIRNSQDPFKADKRRMLESLQPNFSFIFNYADADLRRHSMYFDKHYYPDQFGGGVEATVIYGPTSPLPRYVSVNVTFRGFGRSFNLLEVGYRSEFGGKLRRTLLNEPEEMPSTYDGRELPYPAKHYEFFRESERRNFAFMRIFGHEVFQSTNADRDFMNLYPAQEVQSSLLEVDEVTSLPTIGGLSLQISMLGVSSQKLKYGLNWTNVLIDFDAR
ncbi:unnamed protein product [Schistocephalus solidus]|uniref:Vitellogenin domain-containing protein n=1 Tax=Schistocephalus solidus TaxID=70667 RepID=A0A183SVV4_SCHSO|nr:unnamed protein product [Schistocephalus solidus]